MSDVSGCVRGGLDGNRAFVLGRNTSASFASDSMRWIDFVPSRKNHASAGSQILPVYNSNKEERSMLKDSKAFSGFSAGDIPKAKEFYAEILDLDISEIGD